MVQEKGKCLAVQNEHRTVLSSEEGPIRPGTVQLGQTFPREMLPGVGKEGKLKLGRDKCRVACGGEEEM